MLTRRDFLAMTARLGPAFCAGNLLLSQLPLGGLLLEGADAEKTAALIRSAPRARYWVPLAGTACNQCHSDTERLKGKKPKHDAKPVRCLLCAQRCTISAGERGKCRARMNVGGELRTLVYGRPFAVHIDPIEKKPFYHFLPGSMAFSLSTSGCPLRCKFCQNWTVSQASPEDYETPIVSADQVSAAAEGKAAPIVAFTYNEPTVFTEYLTDISRAATKKKLRAVMISCGFMNEEPLTEMCSVLSAIKIDLKGFSEDFYRNVSSAELQPVLRSIKQIAKSKVHLEIVNLVVPTLNDSNKMLQGLVDWIAGEIGPDVPVHFTRFHPDYQLLNLQETPVATLEKARDLALKKGIHFPYVGNVPDHPGNNTYCPKCKKVVIQRSGFFVLEMNLDKGKCKFCQQAIPGVWT